MTTSRAWWLALLLAAGCASAPPAPVPAAVTYEQKMSWILRLEDQRVLADPAPPPAPPPVATGRRRGQAPPPPPSPPSLVRLLADPEARVRRRAALAIGRVGLADGVTPLVAALNDAEPEVRQMAAFALGLIGDRSAAAALRTALADPAAIVQGRAAEALGLIGDAAAAGAIGEMVAGKVPAAAQMAPDELRYPLAAEVEAFRLGIYALARLKAFEPLAGAVLEGGAQPRVLWWPVASALQRVEDPRAASALTVFARGGGYGASFALRGLAALKPAGAVELVRPFLESPATPPFLVVTALRAAADLGARELGPAIVRLATAPDAAPEILLEATGALGALRSPDAEDLLLDLLSHRLPQLRAAALRSLARIDPAVFLTVLSGLDPDAHWSVRAALADALGGLDAERALPRLRQILLDSDQRAIPSALRALVRIKAPDVGAILLQHLGKSDPAVRVAAAAGLGELTPEGGVAALVAAYDAAQADALYIARGAVLGALAKYGGPAAAATLKRALADKDWAVRVRALELLNQMDPGAASPAEIRPAPPNLALALPDAPHLVNPSVTPHAFIDTPRGTIQLELAVIDAPRTVDNFVVLARKGFFNGTPIHRVVANFVVQDGDPRGDGEGGPGYTIRDEINQQPYLRGTLGMALDWPDTGGSQFFITHSPQPHLDGRYTVFGRVLSGMEVVDGLQQWDVIERVRIWDGSTPMTAR